MKTDGPMLTNSVTEQDVTVTGWPARSNVAVAPNVFVRRDGVTAPSDVAFRVRVRGRTALEAITPPGMIDRVTGQINVPAFSREEEPLARRGEILALPFRLLREQLQLFRPITCIICGRVEQGYRVIDGVRKIGFVNCMHGEGTD